MCMRHEALAFVNQNGAANKCVTESMPEVVDRIVASRARQSLGNQSNSGVGQYHSGNPLVPTYPEVCKPRAPGAGSCFYAIRNANIAMATVVAMQGGRIDRIGSP